jgi:flagellar biosynthesis GTPase FlhF
MARWWQRFANFLHTANLIPLVVLVSSYHYFQALRSHDPVLVAIPIALFVDLLHFRTVQQAVKSRIGLWRVTAVFTTLLAFGLQYIFYSQPGEGEILAWWQVILFASIVPVGLAIMAWHHQQQEQEQVTDWQKLIAEAQQRAEQMQQEAAAEQARTKQVQQEAEAERQRAEEMQARAAEAQVRADEMQSRLAEVQQEATAERERANQMQREANMERERAAAMQAQLAEVQTQADEMQSQLEQVQAEAAQMQITLDEKQAVSSAWQTLNPEMQTLALFNAQLLTAQDAAERLGVHVTTVRRKAKQLNGVSGKNIRAADLEG